MNITVKDVAPNQMLVCFVKCIKDNVGHISNQYGLCTCTLAGE